MKTRLFLITLFLPLAMVAQEWRLNGYTGYVFDDNVNSFYSATAYYDGTINGGFRWGVGLEYLLKSSYGLELAYYRQDTKAPTSYWDNGDRFKDFDLGINYIMLGGLRYRRSGKFEPYGGGQLGVAIFNISNPTNGSQNNETKFAWGLRLGSNIYFNEKIGIKVQADLMSAVQAVGGGFYFGTGGVGSGVTSYSTIVQFGLGGGLVFRFPKSVPTTSTRPGY